MEPAEATKAEEKVEDIKEPYEEDGFLALPETPEEKVEEKGELSEEEEKPLEFKPSQIEKDEEKGDELIDIVHLGQVHRLTKEKVVALAQQGFDYNSKVGPHGKIARMIETDPKIAQMVERAWAEKTNPKKTEIKIQPLDKYENENDWLKGNLQAVVDNAVAEKVRGMNRPSAVPPPQMAIASQTLMMRDPKNYQAVLNGFPKYLEKLSVENYKRVDTDLSALCEFYDFVKTQELPSENKAPTPKPTFKVRSGGGVAPKQGPTSAWEVSNEEFDKQIARIKGYS